MIENLHISNYALIDAVDISFHSGFNIITGETGAGKSIMLGALSLLLGGRADTKAVRDPQKKSVIEAVFSIKGYSALEKVCIENDIDWDPEEMILRREIAPGGRSRGFVNDTPVTIATLQTIALQLVDIHSQHQNLLLVSPPYQLRIIDSIAGNQERLHRFEEAYAAYRAAVKEYQIARRNIEQARDDEEFLRYQFQQLTEAALEPGEQDTLERDREVLTNIADIKSSLRRIIDALGEGDENVDNLLKTAYDESFSLSDLLDGIEGIPERLESLRVECRDICQTFADADRQLTADPAELEAVESRLNEIYDLQRRFKCDSVEALIQLREKIAEQINSIDLSDESLHTLTVNAKRAKKVALDIAREISETRKQTAAEFAVLLKEKALPLGMKNLQVEIPVKEIDLSPTGIDHIEFLFSFNKNQTPMPVGSTASGGEISRLMLSIKSIVADKMQLPSIIFDEVDTGVSGDVANRMGEMMRDISRNIQVIAITHLPQVASQGDAHYKVFKEDTDQTTVTRVMELSRDQRVDELAVMLSGSSVDEASRANAMSLLKQNGH